MGSPVSGLQLSRDSDVAFQLQLEEISRVGQSSIKGNDANEKDVEADSSLRQNLYSHRENVSNIDVSLNTFSTQEIIPNTSEEPNIVVAECKTQSKFDGAFTNEEANMQATEEDDFEKFIHQYKNEEEESISDSKHTTLDSKHTTVEKRRLREPRENSVCLSPGSPNNKKNEQNSLKSPRKTQYQLRSERKLSYENGNTDLSDSGTFSSSSEHWDSSDSDYKYVPKKKSKQLGQNEKNFSKNDSNKNFKIKTRSKSKGLDNKKEPSPGKNRENPSENHVTPPFRRSRRLSEKSIQKNSKSLPSRKKALDNIAPKETSKSASKNLFKYKRKNISNNFIKVRNSYNTEREEQIAEENWSSEESFIDDSFSDTEVAERKKKEEATDLSEEETTHDEDENVKRVIRKRVISSSESSGSELEQTHIKRKRKLSSTLNNFNDNESGGNQNKYQRSLRNKGVSNSHENLEKLKRARAAKKLPLEERKKELKEIYNPSSDSESDYSQTLELHESDLEFINDDELVKNQNENSDDGQIKQAEPHYNRIKIEESDNSEDNNCPLTSEEEEIFKCVENNDLDELIKLLQKYKYLVGSRNIEGKTLLHVATIKNYHHIVGVLFQYEPDTHAYDKSDLLPIQYACLHKHPKCLQYLGEHSREMLTVGSPVHDNSNLLHLLMMPSPSKRQDEAEDLQECLNIIKNFDLEIFGKLLLENNGNAFLPVMTAIDADNNQGLQKLLAEHGQSDVNRLVDYFANVNDIQSNIIHFTIQYSYNCFWQILSFCVDSKTDKLRALVNCRDVYGFTPLMYACELGKDAFVELLLEKGASVNVEGYEAVTPLHLAAASGNLKTINLLLQYDHPTDVLDEHGWPPILYANFRSNEDCVSTLMARNPQHIFCLGNLINSEDKDQNEKNAKVIQSTLLSISHIDRYYTIFNDFISSNISVLDQYNHGLFNRVWKKILNFQNKRTWLKKKCQIKWRGFTLEVKRESILKSTMKRMKLFNMNGLDIRFRGEEGICLGPRREYFACLVNELVDEKMQLFISGDNQQYCPCPNAYFLQDALKNQEEEKRRLEREQGNLQNKTANTETPKNTAEDLNISDSNLAAAGMKMEQEQKNENENQIIMEGEVDEQMKQLDETYFNPEPQSSRIKAAIKFRDYEKELKERLDQMNYIGQILAQVVLDHNVNISLQLAKPFVKKILALELDYEEDFSNFDHEFCKNIKDNHVDELEMPFSFNVVNPWNGKIEEVMFDIDKNITDENKDEYMKLISKFKFETSIYRETDAFRKGFYMNIPLDVINIFNADEFSLLLNGVNKIDVDDWKRHTRYKDGYHADSAVVKWFWNLMYSLKEEEKALMLKFACGTPCLPLGGFSKLQGLGESNLFTIVKSRADPSKLPSASTCFNSLYLPVYSSEKVLREKLLIAIRHGSEGFTFS